MKTTDSAFRNFLRDEITTLLDVDDRIFGTSIEARWCYAAEASLGWQVADYNAAHTSVRHALLDTFAHHKSLAVQQTLYDMATAALVAAPARRYRLGNRGRLEPGCIADIAVVDLGVVAPLDVTMLRYRHPLSPYLGRMLRGRVRHTILAGHTIARDGVPVGPPRGGLVRPEAV